MWLQVALSVGAVVALASVLKRFVWPASSQAIDVGAVSESWLAEQKGSRTDPSGG